MKHSRMSAWALWSAFALVSLAPLAASADSSGPVARTKPVIDQPHHAQHKAPHKGHAAHETARSAKQRHDGAR